MVKFNFIIDKTEYNKKQSKIAYTVNQYPEMIEVVGDFIIKINDKIFFNQPFPILELIRTLERWDKTSNMFYNCIETEDNPLISFVTSKDGWIIKSPWQLFECNVFLSQKELLESIEKLTESVKEQLEGNV
ncbi:MAG: hypothetical protein H7X86_09070 [Gorillibacterium sp.]|nr:hypothetical protein [Gorillibacterium sp.]